MQAHIQDQPLEAYRYERKFIVEGMDEHQLKALVRLHPAMFMVSYPPRWVNNIYFDTFDLENYQDNVNGAVNRRKIRLRWYHGLFDVANNPMLEIKVKQGLVARKHQYPLSPFQLNDDFCDESIQLYFQSAHLPPQVAFILHNHQPVLINRYKRWYFATWDGRFRVTLDADMTFYHVQRKVNTFHYRYQANHLRVLELKYQKEDDPKAGNIASFFPFSVYKNSKYILGMYCVCW